MSTFARIALLAAGAAAGAVATRWVSSETGRRTLSELGVASPPSRAELTSAHSAPGQGAAITNPPARENKLASRLLRVAQDVRVAMDQREGELRSQLGLPAPDQIRGRRDSEHDTGTHD